MDIIIFENIDKEIHILFIYLYCYITISDFFSCDFIYSYKNMI